MNENAVATKPRVIEAKNGNWYLYFSVRHPFTGKLCPVKIEKGFKKCVSIEEKREHGLLGIKMKLLTRIKYNTKIFPKVSGINEKLKELYVYLHLYFLNSRNHL